MSRITWFLLVVIVAEVLIGGIIIRDRLCRPVPPQADWALLEQSTADQLRTAVNACKTADDWRDLGEWYMAAGCFVESESCHRVACDLNPTSALFARQWGFALERLALLEEANTQYTRAIELGTDDPDACRYFIARNHLRAGKNIDARRVFAEGKALPANRYELARLHLRDGEIEQATTLLESVAAVRPKALQVHLLAYRLAQERGNLRQAADSVDRARYTPEKLQNPFDEEAKRIVTATQSLGQNVLWVQNRDLIHNEHFENAEQLLEQAASQNRSLAAIELLGELSLRQKRFDQSIALFEEFLQRNGPSARITSRIGDAHQGAGRSGKARTHWLAALQLEAGLDLKATHHKLADSFAQSDEQPAADHHRARGHYYVGRDLLLFGYPDKAIAYFLAAVKHDPTLTQAWFYLGESRRLSGQIDLASYRTCLRLNPDHGRALATLAWLEAK